MDATLVSLSFFVYFGFHLCDCVLYAYISRYLHSFILALTHISSIVTILDKRSSNLGQFIIHRGLIISFIQAVFSAIFYFAAIAIYNVSMPNGKECFPDVANVTQSSIPLCGNYLGMATCWLFDSVHDGACVCIGT